MEILLGRHGNQSFPITHSSVSKRHALVTVDDHTGIIMLKDLDSVNGTYIMSPNGTYQCIKSARVDRNTVVRLGIDKCFKIGDLLVSKNPPVEEYNISHLRLVYEYYNNNKVEIETKTGNIMMYRMMALSSSSIIMLLLNIFIPENILGDKVIESIIRVAVFIFAMVLAWQIVSVMNSNLIKRKHANEKYFKKKYTCPKCSYFFGPKLYENILAEGKCPNPACRCKFVEKK